MIVIINLRLLKKIKINTILNKFKPCQFVGKAFLLNYIVSQFGRYDKEYLLKMINYVVYYLEISVELITFGEDFTK